jgi:hypothetical protein
VSAPYQYIVLHTSCRNHPGVLACQAAHAAGESIRPDATANDQTHVVALEAKTSDDLVALSAALAEAAIHHALIREPDPPYNGAATAVGIAPSVDRERIKPFVSHFKVLR